MPDPTSSTTPSVMTAVRVHAYGGAEAARLDHDVMVAAPETGQVQVRIEAAGVNPLDWKVREGFLSAYLPQQLPIVLGWDLAGTVTALGEHISGFAIGDQVMGRPSYVRGGAFAQYLSLPDTELALIPVGLDMVTAAALPLAGTTAYQALVDIADVQPGQHVLVHAAAGGVGHLAVQLARHLGAHVVTTALPADVDFVREHLGVDDVIVPSPAANHHLRNAAPDGYHVVLDLLGGETYHRAFDLTRPGGIVVTTIEFANPGDAAGRDIRTARPDDAPDPRRLTAVARLAAAGHLTFTPSCRSDEHPRRSLSARPAPLAAKYSFRCRTSSSTNRPYTGRRHNVSERTRGSRAEAHCRLATRGAQPGDVRRVLGDRINPSSVR